MIRFDLGKIRKERETSLLIISTPDMLKKIVVKNIKNVYYLYYHLKNFS